MQAPKVSVGVESVVLRGALARPRGSARTYGENRVCQARGCSTVLSKYNPARYCWQHDSAHPFVLRAHRRGPRKAHQIS